MEFQFKFKPVTVSTYSLFDERDTDVLDLIVQEVNGRPLSDLSSEEYMLAGFAVTPFLEKIFDILKTDTENGGASSED